ncbi:MAG: O-antigen ligase family protein [Acidimicrobiales bacterium]|nr:O-antigen ligase family protein [Acidimicrobiales bacterium]
MAIGAIALIVGSDYEFRTRAPDASLEAGIDQAILFELALYAAVAAYLVLVHLGSPRVRRTDPPMYFTCFLVGLWALSLLYTPFVQFAAVRVAQMGIVLAFVVAIASHASRAHLLRFVHAFVALVALSVLYGLAVPAPAVSDSQIGRFSWLAVHPTVSGVLCGLAVVVVVHQLVAGPNTGNPNTGNPEIGGPAFRWPTGAYIGALVVCAGGLLGTQTRGAIVGAGLGAVVTLVSSRDGRRIIDVGVALVVLGSGIALWASETIAVYFARGEDPEKLATLNERTVLWDAATDAFATRPMFGHGVTSSQGIFFEETGLGGGHNAVISLLVELGLVGTVCWFLLVASLIAGIRRLPRRGHDGGSGASADRTLMLAVVTFLLFDGIFFQGAGDVTNVASLWLFMIVAWLVVTRRTLGATS